MKKNLVYNVSKNVQCLKCGNIGAVQLAGNLEGDKCYGVISIGGVVPHSCLACENIGLIDTDMALEVGYKQAFKSYTSEIMRKNLIKNTSNSLANSYVLATDADFSGTKNGAFKYIGTDKYVEVPHVIKGVPVTSYQGMFKNTFVKGVKSTNRNVTNMSYMFANSKLKTLDLSSLDTSNVTNMSYMFANSKSKTLDLSSFDTSKVTNMSNMFMSSSALTLDLSSFDTSKVTNMSGMFTYSELTTLDLSSFDTSNVTNMFGMFTDSYIIILDLSSFDTSNVINMDYIFDGSQAITGYARAQTDVDNFNASKNKPTSLKFSTK